jgi:O-antigen/teichoic acid export membrane protein
MSRKKRAIYGILTASISYFVLIVVQIVLSPLILKRYGQETLGAYASIMQLIGYLTLLDAALNFTFNRFIAQAHGSADQDFQVTRAFVAARALTTALGLLNAALIVLVIPFVSLLFDIGGSLEQDMQMALLILAIGTALRSPFMVYATFLNASQQMAFLNIVSTTAGVLRGLLILLLVQLNGGITGIIFGSLIAEFLGTIACFAFFRLKSKNLLSAGWKVDLGYLKELTLFGKDSLIIQVVNKIRFQTDTLLVGIFLSVSAASVFYSSITPPMMCFTLANLVMSNTLPGMNEIIGGGDTAKIKDIYLRLFRYVALLSFIALAGISFLNRYVVTMWVGIEQHAGWKLDILFALQASLLIINSFNGNFLVAMGKVNVIARLSTWVTIAGLILSVVLLKLFGMVGLMASSVIVLVYGTFVSFKLTETIFGKRIFFKRVTYWS